MKNEQIKKELESQIQHLVVKRDAIQQELFDNFNYAFEWKSEIVLQLNKMLNDLQAVANADSDKVAHLEHYIKRTNEELLNISHTNFSTSALHNFKEAVYRNAKKEVVSILTSILQDNE